MISVYDSKETNFNHNGTVLNGCISCTSVQVLNGEYNVELEYPIDERKKYLNLKGLNIIKSSDGQLFRIPIYSNIQSGGLSIKVKGNHIFYDLQNDFNEDTRVDNKSVEDALKIATAVNPKFHITTCDDLGLNNAYFVTESPLSSIFNKILPRWNGEVYRDNYNIAIKSRLGIESGNMISYSKNILGFEQTLDFSNLATKILLKGKDGLTIDLVNNGSKYLVSPRFADYPFPITKEIKFENIEDVTELKNAGLALWGTIDLPSANYKVTFADLSKTLEYSKFKKLLTLKIGDSILIRHKIFNVDIIARAIKIKRNEITNEIIEIELGQFKENINNHFNSVDKEIITTQESVQETRVDLAETKTTVFQNTEEIRLGALATGGLEDRVDEAELKITPSAIVSTVRNSTSYINDLGQKVTSAQASTIAQTASNVKIGFNGISDVVDIDITGLQVNHTNGDYTKMAGDGFKRYVSGTGKSYHYLTYIGEAIGFTGLEDITITLPAEFKNKDFKVVAMLSSCQGLTNHQAVHRANVSVINSLTSYINATFVVRLDSLAVTTDTYEFIRTAIGFSYIAIA